MATTTQHPSTFKPYATQYSPPPTTSRKPIRTVHLFLECNNNKKARAFTGCSHTGGLLLPYSDDESEEDDSYFFFGGSSASVSVILQQVMRCEGETINPASPSFWRWGSLKTLEKGTRLC